MRKAQDRMKAVVLEITELLDDAEGVIVGADGALPPTGVNLDTRYLDRIFDNLDDLVQVERKALRRYAKREQNDLASPLRALEEGIDEAREGLDQDDMVMVFEAIGDLDRIVEQMSKGTSTRRYSKLTDKQALDYFLMDYLEEELYLGDEVEVNSRALDFSVAAETPGVLRFAVEGIVPEEEMNEVIEDLWADFEREFEFNPRTMAFDYGVDTSAPDRQGEIQFNSWARVKE